ncbi:hypothetical protein Tco_0528475 [Tanacetum coccineum]
MSSVTIAKGKIKGFPDTQTLICSITHNADYQADDWIGYDSDCVNSTSQVCSYGESVQDMALRLHSLRTVITSDSNINPDFST